MDLFGQLPAKEFFENYWQKKPIVFKNAIKEFESPLDADELAGLACEEDLESRLVLEKGGEKPWQVKEGPFNEATLSSLPSSNWSLSVQGVDRALPEVSALLAHFSFLPNWLLDDILVSYAPDAGSVGAHIDNYDVFIVQGQGQRRWLLGGAAQWDEEYEEGLDIRLLKQFEPEYDWLLNSGDVLYIPTRFAHHGIAVGECLNYSVGFRAPTEAELVRSFATWAIENDIDEKFFSDPTLSKQESRGEITINSLQAIKAHMKSFVDSPNFAQWFGEHITEPKAFFVPPEEESHLSGEELRELMNQGATLSATEGLKRAWIASESPALFLEGSSVALPSGAGEALAKLICDLDVLSFQQISSLSGNSDEIWQLFSEIHNRGYFYLLNSTISS